MKTEVFFSVDIEAAGPVPGEYSMLSLGACVVGKAECNFYKEFAPTSEKFLTEAMAVSKLDFNLLKSSGSKPEHGMLEFKEWILHHSKDCLPVFVGFNAPFDWSFVNYYFHLYLGENPFGFSALDTKALFMGATGSSWDDTRSSRIKKVLGIESDLNHHALDDAIAQAELFERVLAVAHKRK